MEVKIEESVQEHSLSIQGAAVIMKRITLFLCLLRTGQKK